MTEYNYGIRRFLADARNDNHSVVLIMWSTGDSLSESPVLHIPLKDDVSFRMKRSVMRNLYFNSRMQVLRKYIFEKSIIK